MRRDKLDGAEEAFQCALKLHRQAQDVVGEATDLHKLDSLNNSPSVQNSPGL